MANGAVFARTAGDPTNPLVLYIHDGGMLANNTSLMWCGLMSSLSTAKRESFAVAAAALKEREDAGGRRKGRQSQGGGGDAGGGDGSMPRLNLKGVGPAGADKGTGRDGGSDDAGGEGMVREEDDDKAEAEEFDDRFATVRGRCLGKLK